MTHAPATTRRMKLSRIGAGSLVTDSLCGPDRVVDNRAAFRRRLVRLDGFAPLVCGCPRSGPPRRRCFFHQQTSNQSNS